MFLKQLRFSSEYDSFLFFHLICLLSIDYLPLVKVSHIKPYNYIQANDYIEEQILKSSFMPQIVHWVLHIPFAGNDMASSWRKSLNHSDSFYYIPVEYNEKSTDFSMQEKSVNFCVKIGMRSWNFLYLYFYIYWLIDNFMFVLKFLWDFLDSNIWLSTKIWRIKTQNNLSLFPYEY